MLGPFIMVDELIYSELGRSLAAGDGFQVRGAPASGFSLVYPILISPAYALFDSLPEAYAAVKTINALLMSLTAIPVYLLARRLVAPPLSLVAALLAVALPSLAYTGTVMTENIFYPLFVTAALVFVLVLERPTPARQVGLLALVGVLFATRVQAVAFVPAIVAAPFLLALLGKLPLRSTLKRFRLLYALLAGGALLVLIAQVARGRSLSDLLGAYSIVGERSYDPETVARFFLYHLAELDLYLGVIPFAAFLLLTALARRSDPILAPFLAAGIALTVSVLLVVAAFASEFANRIQERNTFVVAPFFLIALVVWVDRGLPRPRWTVADRGCGGAAAACDPLGAVHRDGCGLGHARAAADLECLRLPPLRLDRCHRLRRGRARGRALSLRPACLGSRAPRGRAALPRRRLLQRLVRRARLPAGLGGGAVPGDPRRREGLDRPGGSERRHRGVRLEGRHRPLRRQPERVLQPQRSGRSTTSAGLLREGLRRRRS